MLYVVYTLVYFHSSIAIVLMGKRELVALSSWCLVIIEWLFLVVPWGCLRFVIVVFPDHTHLLFTTVKEAVLLNMFYAVKSLCQTSYIYKCIIS